MQTTFDTEFQAQPFMKWVGGKRQLLGSIKKQLPPELKESKINKYFEPFLGGGAVFFFLKYYYNCDEYHLFDINKELILTYNVIKNDVDKLKEELTTLSEQFMSLDEINRKEFYYQCRNEFNSSLNDFDFKNYNKNHIHRAALTIFMNKTNFNGIFRLNKKGEFNVPFGNPKNPLICDSNNLDAVSLALQKANIYNDNYAASEKLIDESSFVYLDPPYRPLTKTAKFTNYNEDEFTDDDQIKLAEYYKRISDKGAKVLLSNSDPKNVDIEDNFFDDLYSDFTITRVEASRSVNSDATKRGKITEILVRNY